MGWQLKAGVALAIAALIGYLVWREHSLTRKLAEVRVELRQANATLHAERENTRKANEAAQRHQRRADTLETDRRNNPLPAVWVRKCPASVPETRAATVPGEAAQADDAGADAGDSQPVDIGPALDDFATDAEANLIQCEELIRWVESR